MSQNRTIAPRTVRATITVEFTTDESNDRLRCAPFYENIIRPTVGSRVGSIDRIRVEDVEISRTRNG